MTAKPKLRIGLLLESTIVPAWMYSMLERIQHSDYARVELVVLWPNIPKPAHDRPRWRSLTGALRSLLERTYDWIDLHRSGEYSDAFAPQDCSDLVDGAPRLHVDPPIPDPPTSLSEADLEAIRVSRLDVLLNLGSRSPEEPILDLALHGVWSHDRADSAVVRGTLAGFWEVMNRSPHTGSGLHIHTRDFDRPEPLFWSLTTTFSTSVLLNRSRTYWKTAGFMPRKLEELHRRGIDALLRRARKEHGHPPSHPPFPQVSPNCWVWTKLLIRTAIDWIRIRLMDLWGFDQWILLFDYGDEFSTDMSRFERIVPPKDRGWADPFVVFANDRHYVFLEEIIYARGKGRISCMEIRGPGQWEQPRPVLEREHHLSYPFLFEFEERLFMLPESSKAKVIEVYECMEFPTRWELCHTLMKDVVAFDSTLHHHGDRWWLFCNIVETPGGSSCDELFLFSADSPLSDVWTPHPLNPIISDATRARPAGRLFTHEGKLHRPSQNCTPTYGYGFGINVVEELSDTGFEERQVSSTSPDWDARIVCTHTFNSESGMTVADALLRRRRW